MKVCIREHKGLPSVCLVVEEICYDVATLLSALAGSKHSHSSRATELRGKELDTENFLADVSAWEYLVEVDKLLVEHLGSENSELLQSARVADSALWSPPIIKTPLMFGLAGNCPMSWRPKGIRIPNYPVGYTRPWTTLTGHNGRVILNADITSFRCAVELGVVIGKEARNVKSAEAMDYVCGYTCVNDMISNHWKVFAADNNPTGTADFKELLITSYYGRGTDGFAPIGPYIVSKEEVGDHYNLLMHTKQNGRLRDRTYTNAMVVGIENTIEYLSSFMTLLPGSIIHMGTMGVDGITMAEDVRLGPDDYVEVEIEGVGSLRTLFDDRREVAK